MLSFLLRTKNAFLKLARLLVCNNFKNGAINSMKALKNTARALALSIVCLGHVTTPVGAQTADATELAFLESVGSSGNLKLLQAYLAAYPEGSFVALAQIMIADLGGTVNPPPAEKTAVVPTTETPSQSPSADLLAIAAKNWPPIPTMKPAVSPA